MWIAGLGIWKPGVWPLKDPDSTAVVPYIDKALRGKILTRMELATAITKQGATPRMVDGLLGSWGGYLKHASFAGYLCFASSDGEARFTHPATWLRKPPAREDSNKAFDWMTSRYLSAYGPATPVELGPRWWGINQGNAKRRLAALGDRVTEVRIEGARFWMLTEDVAELEATEPVDVVRLLPAFDQWVVCASRRVPALSDPEHHGRIYRAQGWVSPVLLVNGRMAGIWKHEQKGTTVSVKVEPFAKLPRWVGPHIADEAGRVADFLGGKLELTLQR
jgi:hypothetical protein